MRRKNPTTGNTWGLGKQWSFYLCRMTLKLEETRLRAGRCSVQITSAPDCQTSCGSESWQGSEMFRLWIYHSIILPLIIKVGSGTGGEKR